ncbi:GxxExxY protein [Dokdonia sinensis]|uniref:GxxExxY protein n=1 Tax=Dokdonia sinensis TaxID=2479847 RepID=A0A3M0FUY3_9FLAO|nr:GxxExxY protein [Dokdonia sinensis]RMB56504.1 GxxExxY protein [Dokdonia sinensis]
MDDNENDEFWENDLASIIVDASYHIHVGLGPGLLESVYEEILYHELTNIGLKVTRQQAMPVIWKGRKMELGFRTDLIVENKVIVEIKSVQQINPVHCKQLLTYLKLADLKLGLLINFNSALIKNGITRIINGEL